MREGEGDGQKKGARRGGQVDNYAIINVYITEVMLFNEVSLRRFKVHLQNR